MSRARTRWRRSPRPPPRHLLRTDGFAHVADIMVGSFYDPMLDEGCAFEELISFHGGLGGPQTRAFVLFPPGLAAPATPVVGAAAVHDLLWNWRWSLQRDEPAHPDRTMRSGFDGANVQTADDRAVVAHPAKEDSMTLDDFDEMGPIDYIVLEWPDRQPRGEVAPLIVDLVDRGIIRVLDVAFMAKGEDGSLRTIELGELDGDSAGFGEFEGASIGPDRQGRPRGGRSRPGAGHHRRGARLGEPLGGARRGRAAEVRRPARRQRPDPDPGDHRRARRRRGRGRRDPVNKEE